MNLVLFDASVCTGLRWYICSQNMGNINFILVRKSAENLFPNILAQALHGPPGANSGLLLLYSCTNIVYAYMDVFSHSNFSYARMQNQTELCLCNQDVGKQVFDRFPETVPFVPYLDLFLFDALVCIVLCWYVCSQNKTSMVDAT